MFDPVSYAMGKNAGGGGGGDITVEALSVTENGTYTADEGKAYSPVSVSVPNSYAAADEGKVVSNGTLVSQTAHAEVTANGTIDTTLNNSVKVNVNAGITLAPMDYPIIIQNGYTSNITVVRVQYDETTLIKANTASITSGNSATYSGMLTDGTHFWFRASNCTVCKYNGVNASFVRSTDYFQVDIPAGFDGTIPFVMSR